MPKEKTAGLIDLRDAVLALERRAVAVYGRSYSRRQVARRLAPGNAAMQARWNNRLHRWLTDGDNLVRPDDFETFWVLIVDFSSMAEEQPDRETWAGLYQRSAPGGDVMVSAGPGLDAGHPAAAPTVTLSRRGVLWAAGIGTAGAGLISLALLKTAGLPDASSAKARPDASSAPGDPNPWLRAADRGVVLRGAAQQLMAMAFRPDGGELAAVGGDGTVFLWTPDASTPSVSVALTDTRLLAVEYTPDGQTMIAGGWSKRVYVVRDAVRNVVSRLPVEGVSIHELAISPDGDRVAIGTEKGEVRVRELRTGRLLRTLPVPGSAGTTPVRAVAFSRDGRWLAAAGAQPVVHVWDFRTGYLAAELRGHDKVINKVTFSDDGTSLASASDDTSVRVWSTSSWQLARKLSGHNG
ncbi:MAG: WD40 repeat domain-containing protein, partial [Nocardioides sp.]